MLVQFELELSQRAYSPLVDHTCNKFIDIYA